MTHEEIRQNHSVLFPLPPIIGPSTGTESLISYLVRLARAHQVKARTLVRNQVWSAMALKGTRLYMPFFQHQARTVNGVGHYARALSGALQTLTAISGLERLTFLPWQGVIPEIGTGFLANEVRWCPDCVVEQRERDIESHFLLLWSLEHYRVCLHHRRRLANHCPWCS